MICQLCKNQISSERLEILPDTKLCLLCATGREHVIRTKPVLRKRRNKKIKEIDKHPEYEKSEFIKKYYFGVQFDKKGPIYNFSFSTFKERFQMSNQQVEEIQNNIPYTFSYKQSSAQVVEIIEKQFIKRKTQKALDRLNLLNLLDRST